MSNHTKIIFKRFKKGTEVIEIATDERAEACPGGEKDVHKGLDIIGLVFQSMCIQVLSIRKGRN